MGKLVSEIDTKAKVQAGVATVDHLVVAKLDYLSNLDEIRLFLVVAGRNEAVDVLLEF